MKKKAFFKSERQANAASRSLKNAGINGFRLEYRSAPDTLNYVSNHNPAGLYLGSGTVYIPEIGFVSGRNIQTDIPGGASYASFLNFSGKDKGITMDIEFTPETEGIIRAHGGEFLNF
ncbi:MAG: hypothetical protein SPL89_02200 [Clostridia bacterium]|nr:hypothetical protein [Clostridia bacterium]